MCWVIENCCTNLKFQGSSTCGINDGPYVARLTLKGVFIVECIDENHSLSAFLYSYKKPLFNQKSIYRNQKVKMLIQLTIGLNANFPNSLKQNTCHRSEENQIC